MFVKMKQDVNVFISLEEVDGTIFTIKRECTVKCAYHYINLTAPESTLF
jgi:hypothetical protein